MRITTLAIRHRARWMKFWKGNQPHPEEINTIQTLTAFALRRDDHPGWEWHPVCWNRMSRGYEYPTVSEAKAHTRYFWRQLSEDTRSCILNQVREWRNMQRAGTELAVIMPA